MPSAWRRRLEENPEGWNKEKKQEDGQGKEGEHEHRQAQQVQKETDEAQLQVLNQPDSLDNIVCVNSQATIRPNSKKGLLVHGYCEEKHGTQSRQRELLLEKIQPLDCSA